MSYSLFFLAAVVCLSVLIVLMLGIGSFARGGQFGKQYSNKLMRLRIILQAIAIILILAFVFFDQRGS